MEELNIKNQSWKLDIWAIFEWILELIEKVKKSVSKTSEIDGQKQISALMDLISKSNIAEVKNNSGTNAIFFLRKHSSARNEWCIKLNNLRSLWGIFIIKSMYESGLVSYWSNDDDFSFYEVESVYEWRKIRIIFYNSCNRQNNKKIPFNKLLEEDEVIRICWY